MELKYCKYCGNFKCKSEFVFKNGKKRGRCVKCERKYRREISRERRKNPEYLAKELEIQRKDERGKTKNMAKCNKITLEGIEFVRKYIPHLLKIALEKYTPESND